MNVNGAQLKAIGDLAVGYGDSREWELVETADAGVIIAIARTRPDHAQYIIGPAGEVGYHSNNAREQLGLPRVAAWDEAIARQRAENDRRFGNCWHGRDKGTYCPECPGEVAS